MGLAVLAFLFSLACWASASPLTIPLKARPLPLEARMPQAVSPSDSRVSRSAVNLPLTDWIKNVDLQWYASVRFGNPPQILTVIFDTGSSGTLIPRKNCTTCGTHHLFDPDASSTFSPLPGDRTQLKFGTGGDTIPFTGPHGGNGTIVTDDMTIQNLNATDLQFILVDEEDFSLNATPFDGIAGLAPPSNSSHSFYWKLYYSGQFASPVFSFYTPPGRVHGGEFTLGGIDKSKYSGQLNYIPMNQSLVGSHGKWVLDLKGVYFGRKQFDKPGTQTPYFVSEITVLDTGTAFLMPPSYNITRDLYAQISPQIYQIDPAGAWGAPCRVLDSVATDLTFTFGPNGGPLTNLTIPREYFNLGPYPGQSGICQAIFNNPPGYTVNDDGRGVWVFGSPLLKQYYTAWDGIANKIGFATPKC